MCRLITYLCHVTVPGHIGDFGLIGNTVILYRGDSVAVPATVKPFLMISHHLATAPLERGGKAVRSGLARRPAAAFQGTKLSGEKADKTYDNLMP